MSDKPFTSFVILAAGNSQRMNRDKIFAPIGSVSAVARSLIAAQQCACINEIIVSGKQNDILAFWDLARIHGISKLKSVTAGGSTRQQSANNALGQVSPESEFIALHDGARPLVSVELIEKLCSDAYLFGAAIPFLPISDTIKERGGGFVKQTFKRDNIIAVQTPQVFGTEAYRRAVELTQGASQTFTDDSQMMEFCGHKVYLTEGDPINIKLTYPHDLALAEILVQNLNEEWE